MEFKTEQFFKVRDAHESGSQPLGVRDAHESGSQPLQTHELDVKSTVQMIMQYPNNTEEIIKFINCKIKHFAEFKVKMEILKKEYDQSVMELYSHYMKEDKRSELLDDNKEEGK